jgi:4'-phosphopantetheinyl transferase
LQAVTRGGEVGIDIERADPRFAQEQIPERFFSPGEVAQLRSLPAHQQTAAFFRCWTRKEAYIKARGLGLALALDSFDVSLGPNDPPAFLRGVGDWSVQDLPLRDLGVPAGYAAAIVAEGPAFRTVACAAPVVSALLLA